MEVLDEVYQNLKILHSTSIDGSVICDVNLNVNKIAIIIGTQKSQNSRSQNPVLHLYSASTAEKERELVLPVDYLKSLKFSQTGQFLIAYGLASDIIVISINDRDQKLQILKGHSYFVDSIHIQKQEKLFVSAASFDYLCLWSLEEFKLLKKISTQEQQISEIYSLALSQSNHFLAVATSDERLIIWNYQGGSITKIIQFKDGLNYLEYPHQSNNVLFAYRKASNSLILLNLKAATIIRQLELFSVRLVNIDFIQDSNLITIAQNNLFQKQGCVSLWDWQKGNLLIKQNLDDSVIILKALEKKKVLITKDNYSIKFWMNKQ
ncbi:unnamed protein product (macronuclear) [Paramecium tetraurelia]|uniref:Uncharacterized protein n=1 Tax=Paramecium tetraurelia TaxID=5888 RepID=A0DK17_PARTE|nr:uncharacterized protein GSPATT00017728001 [Paramecium tetraurelia]CAK83384.1 unnamed protein product [Paramecium tetraurelia]|eukprot:XP_001450781.1 hypothetical protein (macronuclear) [Paramecium tetraurelia strain d4-2]